MSSVRVLLGGKSFDIKTEGGETLLSALRRSGFTLPAACGGRGKCGKCRVGVNSVSRLACRVVPNDGDVVTLPEKSGGRILTQTPEIVSCAGKMSGLAAAVDLGTTTVAVRLYELAGGLELKTISAWNAQAAYGGDVISRIQYTMETLNGLNELSRIIRAQVEDMISRALEDCGKSKSELRHTVLVGNTVMQHIFASLPVEGIARAPFKPETLFENDRSDSLLGAPVHYSPCVAGYVGGDITAGLLADGLFVQPELRLFLDIGTNGEMALGNESGALCCAVASGPAFEGAGISCGMPGITGAVSHVSYDRGFLCDIVGGGEAKGICGSGLVDLVAVLLERGVIDESGRLLPPQDAPEDMRRYLTEDGQGNGVFHLTKAVSLTARDVRNLQLAKAAVAGGIRVLLEQRGVTADDIASVELAGGFGNYLSPENVVRIGMLPRACLSKIRPLGNAALAGASMLALDGENWRKLAEIPKKCRYLELSGRDDFSRAFTDSLTF